MQNCVIPTIKYGMLVFAVDGCALPQSCQSATCNKLSPFPQDLEFLIALAFFAPEAARIAYTFPDSNFVQTQSQLRNKEETVDLPPLQLLALYCSIANTWRVMTEPVYYLDELVHSCPS